MHHIKILRNKLSIIFSFSPLQILCFHAQSFALSCFPESFTAVLERRKSRCDPPCSQNSRTTRGGGVAIGGVSLCFHVIDPGERVSPLVRAAVFTSCVFIKQHLMSAGGKAVFLGQRFRRRRAWDNRRALETARAGWGGGCAGRRVSSARLAAAAPARGLFLN